MKKRVKCANCGMVYDILIGNYSNEQQVIGECPECKSNAFDSIPTVWKKEM